jgi:hypothetical protein
MYSQQEISAAMVVLGHHYDSTEAIKLWSVEVDFTNLQEWLQAVRPSLQQSGGGWVVEFPALGERVSPSGAGFAAVLRSARHHSVGNEGIRLNCVDHLILRFEEPWNFSEVRKLIIDLQRLLTLAMSQAVPVIKVAGYIQEPGPSTETEEPIELHTRWSGRDSKMRKLHPMEMMFTAQMLPAGIGPALARWREYRAKHSAVLDSYFATIFGRLYQNHTFLFLAHALELYHQLHFDGSYQDPKEFGKRIDRIVEAVPDEEKWLRGRLGSANRKTLADRLRDLLAKKPSFAGRLAPDAERFAQQVKDTRNYYTHFDPGLRSNGRVAEGEELFRLSAIMRKFLEASFLDDLGLTDAARRVIGRLDAQYVKRL